MWVLNLRGRIIMKNKIGLNSNQYIKAYQDLLSVARLLGLRVVHTNSKTSSGNFCNIQWRIATPLKEKNKLYGIYVLAHELGHAIDCLNGKFPKWFSRKFRYDEWIPTSYIRRLEKSAENFAQRFMKSRGFSIKSIPSFTTICFEEYLMPYWTMVYNGLVERKDFEREINKLYESINVTPYWKKTKKRRKISK